MFSLCNTKSLVSRLGINTTSEDLCYFLTQVGMKDGKVFTTAFQVTCFDESHDLFYDENMWPSVCLFSDHQVSG